MTHSPIRLDQFEAYLSDHNLSRTKPRRLLYRVLADGGPQSSPALTAALSGQVDRATVYRTIDFFLANAIAVRTGAGTIELGESFRPHHHHLTCSSCGREVSIDDPELERALGAVATRLGFALQAHQVELTGLCQTCDAVSKSVIQ